MELNDSARSLDVSVVPENPDLGDRGQSLGTDRDFKGAGTNVSQPEIQARDLYAKFGNTLTAGG